MAKLLNPMFDIPVILKLQKNASLSTGQLELFTLIRMLLTVMGSNLVKIIKETANIKTMYVFKTSCVWLYSPFDGGKEGQTMIQFDAHTYTHTLTSTSSSVSSSKRDPQFEILCRKKSKILIWIRLEKAHPAFQFPTPRPCFLRIRSLCSRMVVTSFLPRQPMKQLPSKQAQQI